MNFTKSQQEKGTKRVFCRYIRKNGKIYFPRKARFFVFTVKD